MAKFIQAKEQQKKAGGAPTLLTHLPAFCRPKKKPLRTERRRLALIYYGNIFSTVCFLFDSNNSFAWSRFCLLVLPLLTTTLSLPPHATPRAWREGRKG